jgi:hypothetical protein
MDTPELKGPDAHTILEALTHAGLKRTHPRRLRAGDGFSCDRIAGPAWDC